MQNPVTDKAVTDANLHRDLAKPFRQRIAGRQRVIGCPRAAHNLQQFHDMRRAEEMQADKPRRVSQTCGHGVDVEIGGVAGQHRVRRRRIQHRQNIAFHLHVLKYRLDHQIGRVDTVIAGLKADRALFGRRHPGLDQAALNGTIIQAGHALPCRLQRGIIAFDQRHRASRAGQRMRDTGPHRAATDDDGAVE